MSKHNYSQYSKRQSNDSNKNKPVERIPTAPVATQSQAPEVKLVEETVNTVVLPEMVKGVVANCVKLNVREEPATNGVIVHVLDVMSEVEIDLAKSTDEWFKVCTAIGVEGYCMRKFINAHM